MDFGGLGENDILEGNSFAIVKVIQEFAEVVYTTKNLNELYYRVYDLINHYIPSPSFYIALYDKNSDKITYPFNVDHSKPVMYHDRFDDDRESITRYALEVDNSILIDSDLLDNLRRSGKISGSGNNMHEWLGVPLKTTGNFTIGLIAIRNYSKDFKFNEEHKAFLSFVSTLIAMAIDRKKSEIDLKRSEAKFKSLYRRNPLMIFIVNKDGIVIEANERIKDDLKYEPEELIGKKITEVFHPDDKDTVMINIEECLSNEGATHKWELRKIAKDGELVWVRETACAVNIDSSDKELLIVCENISEYKNTLNVVKENEEKYRLLAENTSDIIILHDYDGSIKYSNNAGISLSEYTSDEIESLNISDLFDDVYLNRVNEFIEGKSGIENLFVYDVNLKTKNGRKIPLEINVSKLKKRNQTDNLLIVARDIRERKETEKSIREYNEELKKSNHEKDKFFSIIAHDLRSPFNALLSYSEIILEEFDSLSRGEIKEYVSHIQNVSKNVFDLLNNLLDWSRVQTQNIYFEPELFNLSEVINKVVSLYSNIALEKTIEVKVKVDEKAIVFADKNMISTVLRNLLSNALKFTEKEGSISIRVKNKPDYIEIKISDDGIGMLEEDVRRLFRIDINYSTLGTNKERGTGLGLILAKELIEKNGGTIKVESKLGVGSTFSFTLSKKPE